MQASSARPNPGRFDFEAPLKVKSVPLLLTVSEDNFSFTLFFLCLSLSGQHIGWESPKRQMY